MAKTETKYHRHAGDDVRRMGHDGARALLLDGFEEEVDRALLMVPIGRGAVIHVAVTVEYPDPAPRAMKMKTAKSKKEKKDVSKTTKTEGEEAATGSAAQDSNG